MNKFILITSLLISCFLTAACDNDDTSELSPIQFEQRDYKVRMGIITSIPFVGGGGTYELAASNPDILGQFYIDATRHELVVLPAGTGESTLTITDTLTETSVTLRFTVENFYISFIVNKIDGNNTNPYLSVGNEIRFIRDEANSRQVMIMYRDNLAYEMKYRADGWFDIERSDTNIFTLQLRLHTRTDETSQTFTYTMGGDSRYLSIFEAYFGYDWDKSIASKSQPVQQVEMILADEPGDCRISCLLQPF